MKCALSSVTFYMLARIGACDSHSAKSMAMGTFLDNKSLYVIITLMNRDDFKRLTLSCQGVYF